MQSIPSQSTLVIPDARQIPPVTLYFALNEVTALAGAVSVGTQTVSGSDYARAGTTRTAYFSVCCFVSGAALTAHALLYDLTDAAALSSDFTTSSLTPVQNSEVVTIADASHLLTVQYWVTGGALPADTVTVPFAGIRFVYL